jgi:hypothetical protein
MPRIAPALARKHRKAPEFEIPMPCIAKTLARKHRKAPKFEIPMPCAAQALAHKHRKTPEFEIPMPSHQICHAGRHRKEEIPVFLMLGPRKSRLEGIKKSKIKKKKCLNSKTGGQHKKCPSRRRGINFRNLTGTKSRKVNS